MSYQIGDKVTWSSQAHGCKKSKCGEVVEVVLAGRLPNREKFVSLYKHNGIGSYRSHESYVVKVKSRFYWPRVIHLTRHVSG